jgi:hypothetical protein
VETVNSCPSGSCRRCTGCRRYTRVWARIRAEPVNKCQTDSFRQHNPSRRCNRWLRRGAGPSKCRTDSFRRGTLSRNYMRIPSWLCIPQPLQRRGTQPMAGCPWRTQKRHSEARRRARAARDTPSGQASSTVAARLLFRRRLTARARVASRPWTMGQRGWSNYDWKRCGSPLESKYNQSRSPAKRGARSDANERPAMDRASFLRCRRSDLNRHVFLGQRILSPPRLPVPPLRLVVGFPVVAPVALVQGVC